ncbi:hypothetical protein BT93_C0754 [Corymbia citriodora subsp. variegata]|nr:hypothetical protein BT93_C0754 [Corymbia citriodora subsp. variegata]
MAALLSGSVAQVLAPPPGHPKGAVTYTVGDAMGWTIPASGAAAYQAWASSQIFEVGDILVFNFNGGAHDVAEVTETAFNSCDGTNPLSISTVPPARITLATAGLHFFICAIPGHCSLGQKVTINVTTAGPSGSPPPSSSVAPSPKAATPPSATTPTSSTAAPNRPPSASTPSSLAAPPQTGTVTPVPSTVSHPPKAATPLPSATLPPSSMAAPPSSTPAPSAVAASPAGDAVPPTQGNSAASLGVTGVSAVILTAAVALLTSL